MADLSPIEVARFWSRVNGSTDFQCWEWTGRTNWNGYGRFKNTMAHRVAYELTHDEIPDGLIVRHRCDNRLCCNPAHLELGTSADNSGDAIDRDRIPHSERHKRAKLTEDQVRYIRQNPDGLKLSELARMCGIAPSTASYVRSGRSYKYVKPQPCSFEPVGNYTNEPQ